MSWKLAELRWRHEIGLYESRWEKDSGALPVERKRAIEVFERRVRRSQSLSASRCGPKSNLDGEKDVGLGDPVVPASPTARSSIDTTTRHTSPLGSSRGRTLSCSSLVPLLQTTPSCPRDPRGFQRALSRGDPARRQPATRFHSRSAFSRSSSEATSLSPDQAQHLEADANESSK